MSPRRTPVSTITGRRQAPALRVATVLAFSLALVAVVAPNPVSRAAAIGAVGVVAITPLLRVVWLILRWVQERDWRFVGVAVGLLAVIGLGGLLALAGV